METALLDQEKLDHRTQAELVAEVDRGCRDVLLAPDAPPPRVLGVRLWPNAIPQYELGHSEIIDQLEREWLCERGEIITALHEPDEPLCVRLVARLDARRLRGGRRFTEE